MAVENKCSASAYHTCPGSYFLLQEKIAIVGPLCLFIRKRKIFGFDFDFDFDFDFVFDFVLLFSA